MFVIPMDILISTDADNMLKNSRVVGYFGRHDAH